MRPLGPCGADGGGDGSDPGEREAGESGAAPKKRADGLEAMGTTFVKLGQVLAGRPESLGQVNLAALGDGREVAVKVQRPDFRRQIADDFKVLSEVAHEALHGRPAAPLAWEAGWIGATHGLLAAAGGGTARMSTRGLQDAGPGPGDAQGHAHEPAGEPEAGSPGQLAAPRTPAVHLIIAVLGTIGFLYVARPVVLPILLAWMAAMTLQPLVRGLSYLRLPTAVSAALIFSLLVAVVGAGFIQLERPAERWMNEAPQRMTELRQRAQRIFPKAWHFGQATEAVGDFGRTEAEKREEQRKTPMVEVKDQRGTSSILSWTGTLLAGLGEVLVLIYLFLASGDLFLQKLVRLVPTFRGKVRAVQISHEIQRNISKYLFSIAFINVCLGALVSAGLHFMGIPNAAMWGMLVALLNFVPYFGPICGVAVLAAVGLLTFDSPWRGLLPPGWYMALHLLEANLVTPTLLGRRFTLSPVAIFVSLIFWIWLWGVPGALLSVPILVSIKVVCDRIPRVAGFGELIGR